jgi:anti-sigma regulatory factor (Ser/Thr protein kinase)
MTMEKEVIENEQEITVEAKIEQIPVISNFVESVMSFAGFDSRKAMEVLLVMEEACTNIANYAYPGKSGTIHIVARVFYDRLTLIIEDHGALFDPTAYTAAIPRTDVSDCPIGGLGIHLMRGFMDGISFEFKDGKNVLTMVKNRVK